jgi:hypothetical protein
MLKDKSLQVDEKMDENRKRKAQPKHIEIAFE